MSLKRDEMPQDPRAQRIVRTAPRVDPDEAAWQRTCFYSSPIGDPGTEQRKHSDVLLDSLVRPAVAALDPRFGVIRADSLPSSPITADVYEHVFCSRLLIADLSFHHPNVLYEVGIRHAIGKPCVLISRTEDQIPSNLKDVRTVLVDTSEIWDFFSGIEDRRAEITAHTRWALSAAGRDSSPVQKFFPAYREHLA